MASISGTIKSGWCLADFCLMRLHPAHVDYFKIMGDLHGRNIFVTVNRDYGLPDALGCNYKFFLIRLNLAIVFSFFIFFIRTERPVRKCDYLCIVFAREG
jgi:hypothetical protein